MNQSPCPGNKQVSIITEPQFTESQGWMEECDLHKGISVPITMIL